MRAVAAVDVIPSLVTENIRAEVLSAVNQIELQEQVVLIERRQLEVADEQREIESSIGDLCEAGLESLLLAVLLSS